MALGSNQPLTEMSTRNLPECKGRPAGKAENLTAIFEPRRLTILLASTACYRDIFTFLPVQIYSPKNIVLVTLNLGNYCLIYDIITKHFVSYVTLLGSFLWMVLRSDSNISYIRRTCNR
jgi:hypothetical protein